MRFYSDVLRKPFDNAEELAEAEAQYNEKVKKEEEKKKAAVEARATDAKKVEEAYAAVTEANKNYRKVLNEFCEKYGPYHFSVNTKDGYNSIFDSLLNFWF